MTLAGSRLLMSTTMEVGANFLWTVLIVLLCILPACFKSIFINEKLDHIPSSWIVLMVHMVKGHQYSVYTVYKPHQCWHLNRRNGVWDWLLTLTMAVSITGDELDSFWTSGCTCYILHKASFIYPRDYVSQENAWSSAGSTCLVRPLQPQSSVLSGWTCGEGLGDCLCRFGSDYAKRYVTSRVGVRPHDVKSQPVSAPCCLSELKTFSAIELAFERYLNSKR